MSVYALDIAGDAMTPPEARTLDDFAYAVALASADALGAISRERRALLVTGEESVAQVKLRAARLGELLRLPPAHRPAGET